jgi:hypothetical protein
MDCGDTSSSVAAAVRCSSSRLEAAKMVTPTNLPRDTKLRYLVDRSYCTSIQQLAVTPQPRNIFHISSGQRLAQHLLRTTAQYSCPEVRLNSNSTTARTATGSCIFPAWQPSIIRLLVRICNSHFLHRAMCQVNGRLGPLLLHTYN